MLHLFIPALLGYLFGAIPFGLLLTKLAGYDDIRNIGSGNIGATNVLRTGNKKLAFVTLLADAGKGAVAVLFIRYLGYGETAAILAGMFAIIGHMFPVWLGFKGGKGVATALGTLLVLELPVGIIACLMWLFMAFVFRYSSLSALVALLATPLTAYFIAEGGLALPLACWVIAALVWYRHKANIDRLLEGREPKIGEGKNK